MTSRRLRRKIALSILLPLGAVAILAIVTVGPVWLSMLRVRWQEHTVASPANMERVARALAVYCDSLGPKEHVYGRGWFPPELLAQSPAPRWGFLYEGEAQLEYGGGFHHWGLSLRRKPGGAAGEWIVESHSEDEWTSPRAQAVSVPEERLTREELLRRLRANYAAREAELSKADPWSAEQLREEREATLGALLAPPAAAP
jgi:hypothetical protein